MAPVTAQLLVGHSDLYHGGIYPTHRLWLSENSRPAWVLEPDRRAARAEQAGDEDPPTWTLEPTVWVPSGPDFVLEDAILLIAIHVLREPSVLEIVNERFPVLTESRIPFEQKPVELEGLPADELAELRSLCRQSDLAYKLVVTVLSDSSLVAQLPVLEDYPMELEVCTVTYSRTHSAWSDRTEIRGSLSIQTED